MSVQLIHFLFIEYLREPYYTPVVGFEPTDLSAPLFSRQFAYNHLHTLAKLPPPGIEPGWPEDTGFTVPPSSIDVYDGKLNWVRDEGH